MDPVSKWSKKERELELTTLQPILVEGQSVAFVIIKPDHWLILTRSNHTLLDITRSVSAALNRRFTGRLLRGLKYDSPIQMARELQELLKYAEVFLIQEI